MDNIAILIDFDGTITTSDTNDELISRYGNENALELEMMHARGELNYPELMNMLFKDLNIEEERYKNFILTEIQIEKGFVEFYDNIKLNHIPTAIVSGGFYNDIIPFLKKFDIDDIHIYANTLIFHKDNIKIEFYDDIKRFCCHNGPCGNCKIQHYHRYKEQYGKVVFIGDGTTDQYVAEIADIVFAKGHLLKYCIENNIEHIPWNNFNDINEFIFNNNKE